VNERVLTAITRRSLDRRDDIIIIIFLVGLFTCLRRIRSKRPCVGAALAVSLRKDNDRIMRTGIGPGDIFVCRSPVVNGIRYAGHPKFDR